MFEYWSPLLISTEVPEQELIEKGHHAGGWQDAGIHATLGKMF